MLCSHRLPDSAKLWPSPCDRKYSGLGTPFSFKSAACVYLHVGRVLYICWKLDCVYVSQWCLDQHCVWLMTPSREIMSCLVLSAFTTYTLTGQVAVYGDTLTSVLNKTVNILLQDVFSSIRPHRWLKIRFHQNQRACWLQMFSDEAVEVSKSAKTWVWK